MDKQEILNEINKTKEHLANMEKMLEEGRVMKTEQEIIKIIVHNEMLLKSYQEKVEQSKEEFDVNCLLEEIDLINNTLETLYSLFK